MNRIIITLSFAALLYACNTAGNEKPAAADSAKGATAGGGSDIVHSWMGTYSGTVPCADCEGIATTLILEKGMRYTMRTTYLGKSVTPTQSNGRFAWDEKGNVVTLENVAATEPNKYKVEENRLVQLDIEGKPITGNLADKYVLLKDSIKGM